MVMVGQQSIVCFAFLFLLLFESTLQQLQPLSSPTEQAALLQLRSSLGLRTKDWPRKADPCTVWNGVKCSNGRVIGINLSGFRRTRIGGRNPQFSVGALVNLTLLVSFNASHFTLQGEIPDWFGLQLGSLQVLDLRSCSIFGAIPWSLGSLANLTSLYLSDNTLTGIIPSSLGTLTRLSVLDLSQNSLTGSIPSSLTSLGNLSVLDMSSNFLSGSIPQGIGNLSNLQYLNLSGNSLSSSIPLQLGDLASLIDLDLSFNSLSGSLPVDLSGLKNLKRLILGSNLLGGSLSNNVFPTPSSLQFVLLQQNFFTGALPDVLWSMPELSFLDISSNNFTGALPNSTVHANTSFVSLNASQNTLYGPLTPVLRRFNSIDLSGNYFQGKVPVYALNTSLGSNCLRSLPQQRTSAECASFYARIGLSFDNFGHPNSTQPPSPNKSENSKTKWIILGVLGFLVLMIIFLILLLLWTRKRTTTNQKGLSTGSKPPSPEATINFSNLGDVFTYKQLVQATGDFNDKNLIKHGHSGDLFRGVLENGALVVIKRIDKHEAQRLELDFFSKVSVLVSHSRFVPLLGYCWEDEDVKFLVYKYMPNGDLSGSLFRKANLEDDSLQSLDWITRLKIATGAAEGLCYLHHECTPPLVHRDVQASSILLDDKFEVRLGSLSEVCTQEGDANQSMITRLLRLPQSSEQSTSGSQATTCGAHDVYCFGKVLLELVTGQLGISGSSEAQTKERLGQILPYISVYDKELVTKIVDPSLLVDEDLLEEVWAMAIVARSCLNPKPTRRPVMRYIVKALENPLKVVREESFSSGRLRTTSSRGSWNAAVRGGKAEGERSLKCSGTAEGDQIGDNSSSRRRHSREICPEPAELERDVDRD